MDIRKICIFTGAGIGVPLGLPITNGFDATLNNIDQELLEEIGDFYRGTNNARDIEKVLYLLEDFIRDTDFTFKIIRRRVQQSHYQLVFNDLIKLQNQAKSTINNIKSDIFSILNKFDKNIAHDLYSGIIKELQGVFSEAGISFFTTNYDLTFERAFLNSKNIHNLGVKRIQYGFQTDYNGLIYDPSIDFDWAKDEIEYRKLHGSLDWIRDENGCFKTGAANNPKEPGIMPLLYPGFKGTPTSEPFIDMHNKLYQRLEEAQLMFVLGFAFRDEYINNIFEFSLKKNKAIKIFCLNPCKPEELPIESKLNEFANKYPENFFHLECPVEITAHPLNLNVIVEKYLS